MPSDLGLQKIQNVIENFAAKMTANLPQPSIVRMGFKCEDFDDDDRIVGPVTAYYKDGTWGRVNDGEWVTRRKAESMANSINVPLEEF